MPIRSRSLSTQPNKFKDSFVYLWLSMFRNVCDGVTCSATKWLVIGGTGILYMGWDKDTKYGTSMICNVWYDVICIATKLTGHTCIANTKDASFRISHVWWLMSCVQTRAIYKKSPRGAASGMSRCHFLGDFSCLSCPELLSCGIRLKLWYVGVRAWGSKLARGIDHLWSWARFMAAQILAIISAN